MLILNEKKILENSATHSRDVDKIMSFKEFVKFNNINLDEIFVDKLFHNIDGNLPIYMDETMIEYFGYSGTSNNQKKSILHLINENFENVKNQFLFTYSNASYKNYLKNFEDKISDKYPPVPTGRGTNTTKHILVHPKLFKAMLMMCQTKKGKRVRRYFLDIEEAIFLYMKYQCKYKDLLFTKEYKELFSEQYTRQQSILTFDSILNDKYRIGCVYFIKDYKNYVKIGWCWHLPTRLSQLQVANSLLLTVAKYEICQFPQLREQYLHKKYNQYHVRGEWYTNDVLL
jgi:hypothetical protein